MDMPPPPSYNHTVKERKAHMFVLPPLPYAYNALEPHIDAKTMEIHHTKHHQAYVDNLNKALADYPELQKLSLEELLKKLDTIPEKIRTAIRNNGGGHWNHSFFWKILTPKGEREPKGSTLSAIKRDFGSFEDFKNTFTEASKTHFGSGWTWLCSDNNGKLSIISTPNQDTPLTKNLSPILALDTWEHAYYLKYQNRRIDYIQAWWHIINWEQVETNYKAALENK